MHMARQHDTNENKKYLPMFRSIVLCMEQQILYSLLVDNLQNI
jgi:hypothetical protein